MRLVDAILAFPLIMAIAFISVLGHGRRQGDLRARLLLGRPVRPYVRSDVLQVRAQAFVEAAGLMGVIALPIVWRTSCPT